MMSSGDAEAKLIKAWVDAFTEEVKEYSKPEEVLDEEVFADVYHSLIHSTISSTLLQLEHANAAEVARRCDLMDAEMKRLDERQAKEMSDALERAKESSEEERRVNNLAGQHMEERQMAILKWESELGHLRETQYREFKEWVMCVHEELKTNSKEKSSSGLGGFGGSLRKSESSFSVEASSLAPVFQESFTITLGAQMKQMHNLRLVAADVLDLCRFPSSEEDALPQRLQTSMSLYSNNLCGLVLLGDGRMSLYTGITKDFADVCQRSTELHFPTLEEQVRTIKEDHLAKALKWREEHRKDKVENADHQHIGGVHEVYAIESNKSLRKGDFYITRHSNLCGVHVIFHMSCDDSVMSGSINSRHPVVMGIRNVLKTASLSDVTTLTIPLLLSHKMSEEMTVQWCMKRGELVFKCVKGFMMEVMSWGGSEIKTLQFLVPKDIDRDVFDRLTAMLNTIFRTSNPILGK